jgi:hypothetical protein
MAVRAFAHGDGPRAQPQPVNCFSKSTKTWTSFRSPKGSAFSLFSFRPTANGRENDLTPIPVLFSLPKPLTLVRLAMVLDRRWIEF